MLYIVNYKVYQKDREEKLIAAFREKFEFSPLMPGSCVLSTDRKVSSVMRAAESAIKNDTDTIFIVPFNADDCDGYIPDPIAEWIINRK